MKIMEKTMIVYRENMLGFIEQELEPRMQLNHVTFEFMYSRLASIPQHENIYKYEKIIDVETRVSIGLCRLATRKCMFLVTDT